jgi:two-component system, LytTR family, sensor kinase
MNPPTTASTLDFSPGRVLRLLVAGAIAVGALDALQFILGFELRGNQTTWHSVGYAVGTQFLPWCWLAALLPGVVWAAGRWPLDGGRWQESVGPHLAMMVCFALVQIAGAIAAGVAFGEQTVEAQVLSMKLLLFRFPVDVLAYWSAVGATQAARAAATARDREQRAARLEASLIQVKLGALRDRLNPHFVFNTLNAVSTLALRRDHAGVIRIVEAMSDLLRVTLAEGRGQEAPLEDELGLLDRYLEIEQLRFGDRLTLERSVDPAVVDALVPVMLIQPLVENAIRHGAAVTPGPVSVRVSIEREGDELTIAVADTGPGFGHAPSTNGTGIGLGSCRARLAGLYGDRASLTTGAAAEGGALVRVRIPYRAAAIPVPV